MNVYIVWHNTTLQGVFDNGTKAVARLNEIKARYGSNDTDWTRLLAYNSKTDRYVQRWIGSRNPDRLAIERETVE
jgi:hypothetical protein